MELVFAWTRALGARALHSDGGGDVCGPAAAHRPSPGREADSDQQRLHGATACAPFLSLFFSPFFS
eukprot:113886-Pleurochrysis_carterae.AAC.1